MSVFTLSLGLSRVVFRNLKFEFKFQVRHVRGFSDMLETGYLYENTQGRNHRVNKHCLHQYKMYSYWRISWLTLPRLCIC